MIPKSGHRFSEKDHAPPKSMIPKSGHRFSEKDHAPPKSMIPKSGHRFSEKDHAPPKSPARRIIGRARKGTSRRRARRRPGQFARGFRQQALLVAQYQRRHGHDDQDSHEA